MYQLRWYSINILTLVSGVFVFQYSIPITYHPMGWGLSKIQADATIVSLYLRHWSTIIALFNRLDAFLAVAFAFNHTANFSNVASHFLKHIISKHSRANHRSERYHHLDFFIDSTHIGNRLGIIRLLVLRTVAMFRGNCICDSLFA